MSIRVSLRVYIAEVKTALRAMKTRAVVKATDIFSTHESLVDFASNNLPLVILAAASIPISNMVLATGTCYTMRNRLERMIVDNNLPRTITTDITKPLAEKIAVPFGQKFKALIDSMAADSKKTLIPKTVKMDEPEINDLAIEDTLFEMLGKINSDPKLAEDFDSRAFAKEYTTNLAGKMKKAYFKDSPITVEQIADLINGLKIDGRRNIAELIAIWIEDNGIFGEGFSFGVTTTAGGQHHAR